jgi:hypothetical protein
MIAGWSPLLIFAGIKQSKMKKTIITCGLIAGLISAAWCAISVRVFPDTVSLDTRTWLGYTSMILSFSLIFVCVKQYRDNYNNGEITFGRAFRIGFYISMIGSKLYVLAWLISYYFFFSNFIQHYATLMRLQMIADGESQAAIQKEMANMASYGEMFKNPIFNILITYSEILPVGLIIALIAAAILKKKPGQKVEATQ